MFDVEVIGEIKRDISAKVFEVSNKINVGGAVFKVDAVCVVGIEVHRLSLFLGHSRECGCWCWCWL